MYAESKLGRHLCGGRDPPKINLAIVNRALGVNWKRHPERDKEEEDGWRVLFSCWVLSFSFASGPCLNSRHSFSPVGFVLHVFSSVVCSENVDVSSQVILVFTHRFSYVPFTTPLDIFIFKICTIIVFMCSAFLFSHHLQFSTSAFLSLSSILISLPISSDFSMSLLS